MFKSIKLSPDACLMVMVFAGFFSIVGILIACENIFWEPKRVFPESVYHAHVDMTGFEGTHHEIEVAGERARDPDGLSGQERAEREAEIDRGERGEFDRGGFV